MFQNEFTQNNLRALKISRLNDLEIKMVSPTST